MKTVELRRHTASDGDRLTPEGIAAAVQIGSRLEAPYDLLISSGAQRATQPLASFLAGSGQRSPGGVTVDESFRSAMEERWSTAARESGARDITAFRRQTRPWSSRRRGASAVRCAGSSICS